MRLSIFMTSLLFAIGAFAQSMVKEMDGANTRFIPGAYMKDGQAAIYFSEDEYGYRDGHTMYNAEIFDFELNPLKTFCFENLQPHTVTEYRTPSGTKELTHVIDQPRNIFAPGFLPTVSNMEERKEAFIQWFYDENRYLDPNLTIEALRAGCRVNNNTILINLPINSDYYYIQYQEYCKSRDLYLLEDDSWGFRFNYATTVTIYDGEWTASDWYDVPVANFVTPRCNDVASMNHWNGGVYLPFSQTFFNNDDKFEYVRYKAEVGQGGGGGLSSVQPGDDPKTILFGITDEDQDGDGFIDHKRTVYGIHYSGLEVVNEDGNVIYSFPIPNNCEGDAQIEFFKSDNCILAQVEFSWYDNNDYKRTTRFYRLDKDSGVAKVIRDETHFVAAPNPATSGTPIKIVLPQSSKSRSIIVTSMSGASMLSKAVESGASEVYVPTHGLNPGMYVFSITENGVVLDNCKIIIK